MPRSTQTLLGRTLFGTLVAISLSFGATQALAGTKGSAGCASGGPYCVAGAPDAGCEAFCRNNFPGSGGAHACFFEPGQSQLCCVCVE
jgi:hypothetical protein